MSKDEEYKIKLSVRDLVEFVYASGDIDHRFYSMERAQEGARIHRLLQKSSKDPYEAEVFLKHEEIYQDVIFIVEGRADGIINKDNKIIIDEIKTVNIPLEDIEIDYKDVHWAQVMCYAYFYCIQQEMDEIDIQLTYYQIEFETIKQFEKHLRLDELTSFYQNLMSEYYKWAVLSRDFNTLKIQTIKDLVFPFPAYRSGQRELAIATYKTILDKDVLYAQAPTGIGKTISTLFPSIKAVAEGKIDKIFYLTAKTITRSVAIGAITLMQEKGLRIKSININAKDKMCFLEERNCDPEVCPFARNYYDRANNAMYDVLSNEDAINETILKDYGRKYEVCPFELSLDLSLHCDVIICDYNYLFDPQVYLKRFFMDNPLRYMFLIDEAHNLVDRARSMFSATLSKQRFLDTIKHFSTDKKELRKVFRVVNHEMLELKKQCEQEDFIVLQEEQAELNAALDQFLLKCETTLKELDPSSAQEELQQLYYDVVAYLRIAEFYDEHYVTTLKIVDQDFEVKQFCIDPGKLVGNSLKKGYASCLFSATLTPINYFLELLGGHEDSKRLMLHSPFNQNHLKLLVNDQISTRYKDRSRSIHEVVMMIYETVIMKKGNYIIYCPSYAYMNQIHRTFIQKYPSITTSLQHFAMNELEREVFLSNFHKNRNELYLGFCVIGGMYGEGIDLRGDALIGSIIIGVGLPQINPEQDILRNYFEHKNQMGYAYAYLFPGMNKVLQAAGRVIRSSEDVGIVLLIDDRYSTRVYRQLFPKHWDHVLFIRSQAQLTQALQAFWTQDINK